MPFNRKRETPIPPPTRFDKWSDSDLINCIEAQMRRSGELFRGLSHTELDPAWTPEQLELNITTALQAVQTMRRRVAIQQRV
jgi:hypothetical protein